MKQFIIGISGKAGSGKDTVASMISYIVEVGITKAKYSEWIASKISMQHKCDRRCVHFADSLKDCLSIMFDIPREYFDNREYKEKYYYSFNEHKFINKENLLSNHIIITIDVLQFNNLSTYETLFPNKNLVIKLRDLMQYFGTDLCRKQINDNIWITSTIRKAVDIINKYNVCIIPDVRFKNEADCINRLSLYGGLIKINRDVQQLSHESENIDFSCEYEIDNNGSLLELFYKILNIMQKII